MDNVITNWLAQQGVAESFLPLATNGVGVGLILFVALVSYYLAKNKILLIVQKVILRSKNTWDDELLKQNVFTRIALLVPIVIILFLTPLVLIADSLSQYIFIIFAKVAICFQVARCISALLNVVKSLYQSKANDKYLPLNSAVQVIKLAVYLVATILALSYIVDRSPIYLLSGLGALTAVLLLIFQDTIKGLVASIQISANKMLAPGDWVELPQYGADGDVVEIGLNTVKVQNFDKTVTTIPTYALISGSFKNWRDMFNAGGRRIKRSIVIDVSSIRFYQAEEIESLKEIKLLTTYLDKKQQELATQSSDSKNPFNNRQLTNIGTFRAYIEAYLKQHNKVNTEMTCMVRQLQATATGLPLELYFFSSDQNWINYEAIQADIFDHLYAMAPIFRLRIFQHPTGLDWRQSTNTDG